MMTRILNWLIGNLIVRPLGWLGFKWPGNMGDGGQIVLGVFCALIFIFKAVFLGWDIWQQPWGGFEKWMLWSLDGVVLVALLAFVGVAATSA